MFGLFKKRTRARTLTHARHVQTHNLSREREPSNFCQCFKHLKLRWVALRSREMAQEPQRREEGAGAYYCAWVCARYMCGWVSICGLLASCVTLKRLLGSLKVFFSVRQRQHSPDSIPQATALNAAMDAPRKHQRQPMPNTRPVRLLPS